MLNFSRLIDQAIFHLSEDVQREGLSLKKGMNQLFRKDNQFVIFNFHDKKTYYVEENFNEEINHIIFSIQLGFPS